MEYNYGTSGFRFNHKIIYDISEKIGESVVLLSIKKQETFGIMITASHNQYMDNGVKIVNKTGNMISKEDEHFIVDYVNNTESNNDDKYKKYKQLTCVETSQDDIYIPCIIIGWDTRFSSPNIRELIKKGIANIVDNSIDKIVCVGIVTTPQLHYLVNDINKTNNYKNRDNTILMKLNCEYIKYIGKSIPNITTEVIIDCANGVGTTAMNDVINHNPQIKSKINLVNTQTQEHHMLNNDCGSDFVCTSFRLPSDIKNTQEIKTSQLFASFDGDADRIVFYFYDAQTQKVNLMNGDKISALICYYISKKLSILTHETHITIGVIHTGYSNRNFTRFIHELNNTTNNHINIITKCTATGVKHLHHEAEKYDIGIYFEANGHGTVLFNNKDNKCIQELRISRIFNQMIGDSIADLFGILHIIDDLEISPIEWFNLYIDNPYKLVKIKVNDKSVFKTTRDEIELIEPIELQEFIFKITSSYKHNSFSFVRPSGTEDVIRLYIESDCEIINDKIEQDVVSFIRDNY